MTERERMEAFYQYRKDREEYMSDARLYRTDAQMVMKTGDILLRACERCVKEAREANRQAVRLWYGRGGE